MVALWFAINSHHSPMIGKRGTLTALLLFPLIGCGGDDPRSRADAGEEGPGAAASPGAAGEASPEQLREGAEAIVGFLRGGTSLDPDLLADSITFYVADEGGGARRTVPKGALRDRSVWRVGGHDLVPPAHLTEASLHPGSHVHCHEAPLRSRFASLDGIPHVGVRLAPPDFSSCLQVWNATLLFSDTAGDPALVGVAYDQWEW